MFTGKSGKIKGQYLLKREQEVLFGLLDSLLKDYSKSKSHSLLDQICVLAVETIKLPKVQPGTIEQIILEHAGRQVSVLTFILQKLGFSGVCYADKAIIFPKSSKDLDQMEIEGTLDWDQLIDSKSSTLPIWTGYYFYDNSCQAHPKNIMELCDMDRTICSVTSGLIYSIFQQASDIYVQVAELINRFLFEIDSNHLETFLQDYKRLFDDWQPAFPIEMDAGCFTMISPLTYIFMARGYKGVKIDDLTILFPSATRDELLE